MSRETQQSPMPYSEYPSPIDQITKRYGRHVLGRTTGQLLEMGVFGSDIAIINDYLAERRPSDLDLAQAKAALILEELRSWSSEVGFKEVVRASTGLAAIVTTACAPAPESAELSTHDNSKASAAVDSARNLVTPAIEMGQSGLNEARGNVPQQENAQAATREAQADDIREAAAEVAEEEFGTGGSAAELSIDNARSVIQSEWGLDVDSVEIDLVSQTESFKNHYNGELVINEEFPNAREVLADSMARVHWYNWMRAHGEDKSFEEFRLMLAESIHTNTPLEYEYNYQVRENGRLENMTSVVDARKPPKVTLDTDAASGDYPMQVDGSNNQVLSASVRVDEEGQLHALGYIMFDPQAFLRDLYNRGYIPGYFLTVLGAGPEYRTETSASNTPLSEEEEIDLVFRLFGSDGKRKWAGLPDDFPSALTFIPSN